MVFIIIFIFGIFLGSFLNVLADRLPREESVIKGRSHCDKCKKTLQWYDLIPLLSFIFLKGKCRYCHVGLSYYYPVTELATGLLFAVTYLFVTNNVILNEVKDLRFFANAQNDIMIVYYLFIVSSLIVVFFADLKYGIIPDKIVFPAVFVSSAYIILNTPYLIQSYFLSALGAGLFFLLLFLGTKGRGMGFGDVKFAFLMGLILGFPNIVVSLYVAFLTGAIVGIILILWRRKKMLGTTIPFGPFLVLGAFSALFWGDFLLRASLHLLGISLIP